jgi:hypothetical protein
MRRMPLSAGASLAVGAPAGGLCVGHHADAECSDKHADDDQLLYHWRMLLQD